MERAGRATHLPQGYGAPSIEGKATRVGASEPGRRASFNYEVVSEIAVILIS